MPREADPFRRHVEVGASKWKCKFCGKDFGGSATRIRAHLAGVPGYGIRPCERVDDHVRSQASKAMKGKSVAVVLGGDPHDVENSHQNVPQQPSCHWQNGSIDGAGSVDRQYQESLYLADMPVGDPDMPQQPNGSIQRLNEEHGNGTSSSLQQPSTDPLASILLDPSQLPELFDQFIDLERRYEQQNGRGPSPLQNHQSFNDGVTNGLHQSTRPGVAAPGLRCWNCLFVKQT